MSAENDSLLQNKTVVITREKCTNCGAQLTVGAKHCRMCGHPVPDKPDQTIPLMTRFLYGAPSLCTWPMILMFGIFGKQYFERFGATLQHLVLWTAAARALSLGSDPIMAYWSDVGILDKLQGRRLPFVAFGCLFYAGFWFALLNPPFGNEFFLNVWYVSFLFLAFLAATFTLIPFDAIGPELSKDPAERSKLFYTVGIFEIIGLILAIGLPISMQQVGVEIESPTSYICQDSQSTANHCLKGQSCQTYFAEGRDGAFVFDTQLAITMADVSYGISVQQPIERCLSNQAIAVSGMAETDGTYNTSVLTPLQKKTLCQCMDTCAEACDTANKRFGFFAYGLFAGIWFVIAIVAAWLHISYDGEATKRIGNGWGFVPMWRQTLQNNSAMPPFIKALWCDNFSFVFLLGIIPYFTEVVMKPEFLSMDLDGYDCAASAITFDGGFWKGEGGHINSGNFDWRCRSVNVTAAAYFALFFGALVAMPIWNILKEYPSDEWKRDKNRHLGKLDAWLLSSKVQAVTLVLFVITVGKGGCTLRFWEPHWSEWLLTIFGMNWYFIMCFLCGMPFGAKFLESSILADIVDYDEFVTGDRREAAYFMFKSLIPKVVMVPALTVPICILSAAGLMGQPGGTMQDQGFLATYMTKGLFIFSVMAQFGSFFIYKWDFPIWQKQELQRLVDGIELMDKGAYAEHPFLKKEPKPPAKKSDKDPPSMYKQPFFKGKDWDIFQALMHFDVEWLLKDRFKVVVKGQKVELPTEKELEKLIKAGKDYKEKGEIKAEYDKGMLTVTQDLYKECQSNCYLSTIYLMVFAFLFVVLTVDDSLPKWTGYDFLSPFVSFCKTIRLEYTPLRPEYLNDRYHGFPWFLITLSVIFLFWFCFLLYLYRRLQRNAALYLSKLAKGDDAKIGKATAADFCRVLTYQQTVQDGEIEPEKPKQPKSVTETFMDEFGLSGKYWVEN